MNKYLRFFADSNYRKQVLAYRGFFDSMDDKKFLEMMFRCRMNTDLDLDDPKTFNEKLQWLKLYDRRPEYTTMVDKYAVKKYVADIIGEQYIIPTLGVWDSFDEIEFEKLPDQFVLKCTHDSGSIVICRNKADFDIGSARKKLSRCLKRNYFYPGREWPYKNVKPRIIAEKYLINKSNNGLFDYKIYCFNGYPRFLYVSQGLDNHNTARISYVTMDWEQADFYREDYKPFETLPPKPRNFEKMCELSQLLCCGIPFLRVDFYEVNDQLYLSELTFYPGSGFTNFIPQDKDLDLGNELNLSS